MYGRFELILSLVLIFFFSCQNGNYQKKNNSVILELDQVRENGPELVKLQIINSNIIRVVASPENTFSADSSLMVINREYDFSDWNMVDKAEEIVVKTDKLAAHINKGDGSVYFVDKKGKIKLQEKVRGRKFHKTQLYSGDSSYHIIQEFQSPSDEAFYGLGQHQNGEMNYKGKNIDLFQHNIVVAVPFLVSSRNYGILWDNYSRTKFGNPQNHWDINNLKLYSKQGKKGGLTATYTDGKGGLAVQRMENKIDYEFLEDLPKIPEAFSLDEGIATWEGYIEPNKAGEHHFYLHCSGYSSLWVEGEKLIDTWRQQWNPWREKFTINMEQGEKYRIKLQWRPAGNEAYFALKYLEPYARQNQLTLSSESGRQIDYYFINGDNLDGVIAGYRKLTGKSPILPKWAMGLWQSRERYKTQEEIVSVVEEFRKRDIPLDNIVLDWQYWEPDKWGSHEFDHSRFPDPEGMIDKLHNDLNTRIMISVWPKYYQGIGHYKEMDVKGYLYKRLIKQQVRDWLGYVATFYDAFNPGARDLFWEQINEHLYSKGIDAWWLDATEPDLRSNSSILERKLQMHPTALGPSTDYFNAYSLVQSKGVYRGQKNEDPNKRVFILTRSAYAGQQRYSAATWSGDVVSTWADLHDQISAGLNFSLSGIPYWTSDIGGFSVRKRYEDATGEDLAEWRELNTRWFQFGTFCPLFRVHGQYPYREMFNIAPQDHLAYQSMLYYDRLRYRLMPYIYSLAGLTYHKDYTIMRALIMDFPEDTKVYDIVDQYMFGPNIMVNPVCEYKARSRKVYLPAGTGWFNLHTGEYYQGGQEIEAKAPLQHIPLFVKEGSIIPAGPEIEYTDQKPANPVTLWIYTGADAHFTLYEDENVNINYKKDKFSEIPINYNETGQSLIIGQRKGKFDGMLQERIFKIIWIDPDDPQRLDFSAAVDEELNYKGKEIIIKRNPQN